MKKRYIVGLAALFSLSVNGQVAIANLAGNNVNARLSNSGQFFNKLESGESGYESPKDGLNHLIYSLSFWYGAKDSGGTLKMAADLYATDDMRDTYPGAIAEGTAEAPIEPYADQIYVISQVEIDYHTSNYAEPGYEMPFAIEFWPAHGDVGLGLDYYLAPFTDKNGNGEYEPELGDYPIIRGDHAAYLIMNDKGGLHFNSGGAPLGIEMHYMFYQFESEDDLNNTTFINLRVINRGTQFFSEFIVGSFMDSEIGYASDDYIGTSQENNMIYGYNGNFTDEGAGGAPGYGDNIPAVGLMALNHSINVGGYFNNEGGPYGTPTSAVDFWNYMNAYWKDGSHFRSGRNGNTTASEAETNFLFSGNPLPSGDEEWNESNAGMSPGDRRMFLAMEPTSLSAGEELCYDYAVITHSGSDNPFENAVGLIEMAPDIQAFYDEQTNNYCEFNVGIRENEIIESVEVYPNPSTGTFMVDIEGQFDLEIYGMDGRLMELFENISGQTPIQTKLLAGTYILAIRQDQLTYRSTLVIN